MKKVTKLFALLLVLTLLLCGCGAGEPAVPTEPQASTPTEALPTEPIETQPTDPEETEPEETEPEETQPEGELFSVSREGHYVFEEPSFDSTWVQGLPAGVYTIVDRAQDDEGFHWGKLKSGMGWICLDEITLAEQSAWPIAMVEAYDQLLKGDSADIFELPTGRFYYKMAFFAYEELTDMKLYLIDAFAEQPTGELKWEQDSLSKTRPVILHMEFPGDFTTYELTFRDESGTEHIYRIMQSGRNGIIGISKYSNNIKT